MSGGQLYNLVSSCNTTLNNLNYNLVTLMGWLDPANGGGTSALLNQILNALVYTNVGGSTVSFLLDLRTESQIQSSYLYSLLANVTAQRTLYLSSHGLDGSMSSAPFTSDFYTLMIHGMASLQNELAYDYSYIYTWLASGYNAQQTYTDPFTLNSSTFTPTSISNGVYTWLSKIQNPVARLSYVLASDERIEAQEAAAANEQAVVDNFIDSSGAGSASPSDIGSVSDLSSGFSSNISTDADPGDIFDIFDSNNFSWFSQEVADSLDTTNSNNRSKSGFEYNTPLLDQRIDDIYDALGVKHD